MRQAHRRRPARGDAVGHPLHRLRPAALSSQALHLTKRFFGSVPVGPSAADERWALEHLTEGEVGLWRRMSRADRRHAAGVARRVEEVLGGGTVERPVVAAALLHDVGKVASGLGTLGRVIATLSAAAAGRDMADHWSRTRGFTRRVGLYLQHPRLGADLLALAGADPLTVAWAREHHLPQEEWTIPPELASALKAADDD